MSFCRLAIVISHPIQHFAPLYQELAKYEGLDFKVFFLAENGARTYYDEQFSIDIKWDVPLTDGYPHEFLHIDRVVKKFHFFSMDSRRLVPALKQYAADVIWLHGYAQLGNCRVLCSSLRNKQIIYSSDSNLADIRYGWFGLIKRWYIKLFFSQCDYFLSISSSNRRYLKHYGVPDPAIVDTSFPVDIKRFVIERANLSEHLATEFRHQLDIPEGAKIILFAGKMVAHKGPKTLLEAIAMLDQKVYAVFLGNGELMAQLIALAEDLGVDQNTRFAGFVNQGELAAYFELADLFVFPSLKEPYGAVAAETLPFGLPIIAADCVGAIGSAIIEGKNALLFHTGDSQHLCSQIRVLLNNPDLFDSFGRASTELAMAHDKSVMARDIVNICRGVQNYHV